MCVKPTNFIYLNLLLSAFNRGREKRQVQYEKYFTMYASTRVGMESYLRQENGSQSLSLSAMPQVWVLSLKAALTKPGNM